MFGDWFDGCWAMWIAKGSLKMGKSVFQAAFYYANAVRFLAKQQNRQMPKSNQLGLLGKLAQSSELQGSLKTLGKIV